MIAQYNISVNIHNWQDLNDRKRSRKEFYSNPISLGFKSRWFWSVCFNQLYAWSASWSKDT